MKSLIISAFVLAAVSTKAQTTVNLGNGTSSGTSAPVASWYNSSATESIYTGTEIGTRGTITKISYQKASGSSTTEPNVKIYMKATELAVIGTAAYSLGSSNFDNYTLVYDGTIPNATTTGIMEISLQTPFAFSDISKNLSVLVLGSTCIASGRPQYRYTTTPSRMSAGFTDGRIGCDGSNPWNSDSSMSPAWERPNLILTLQASLSVEENTFGRNDVHVFVKNGQFQAFSKSSPITEITVFDLAGRKLADIKNTSETVVINLNLDRQILIVRIKTADNTTLNKKIIF